MITYRSVLSILTQKVGWALLMYVCDNKHVILFLSMFCCAPFHSATAGPRQLQVYKTEAGKYCTGTFQFLVPTISLIHFATHFMHSFHLFHVIFTLIFRLFFQAINFHSKLCMWIRVWQYANIQSWYCPLKSAVKLLFDGQPCHHDSDGDFRPTMDFDAQHPLCIMVYH